MVGHLEVWKILAWKCKSLKPFFSFQWNVKCLRYRVNLMISLDPFHGHHLDWVQTRSRWYQLFDAKSNTETFSRTILIQSFVSKPHSKVLFFSKLLQNFIIKYWCDWLSAIDIYHSSQNQKENSTILVIIHKKWKLKGEKKLEKWDVHFVSKPNTCHLGHLKTTKMSEFFLGGRPS